jgi:hypothetical protein
MTYLSFAFLSSAQATYSPIRNLFAFCNMVHSSSSSRSAVSWSWDRRRLSGCLSISLSKPMRFQKRGEHDPKSFTLLNGIGCTLSVAGWSIDLNQEDPHMRYATSRQRLNARARHRKSALPRWLHKQKLSYLFVIIALTRNDVAHHNDRGVGIVSTCLNVYKL